MTELYYIDGERLDVSADASPLSLVFQSPYFTDINAIVGNRSNQAKFPATPRNLRAIGYAGVQGDTAEYPYTRHTAVYVRDGVQVFRGLAILQSVTPTEIAMSFTWGDTEPFRAILGQRLRDMQRMVAEDFALYKDGDVTYGEDSHISGYMSFGAGKQQPVISAAEVAERIDGELNADGLFDGLQLPLLTQEGKEYAKDAETIIFGSGASMVQWSYTTGQGVTRFAVSPDLTGGRNVFSVPVEGSVKVRCSLVNEHYRAVRALRVRVAAGISYDVTAGVAGTTADFALATWENGASEPTMHALGVWTLGEASGGWQTMTLQEDIDATIETMVGSEFVAFALVLDYRPYTDAWTARKRVWKPVEVAANPDEFYWYPLWLNLPDWDALTFTKNVMAMRGQFAAADGGRIAFAGVGELYAGRGDVTGKGSRRTLVLVSSDDSLVESGGDYIVVQSGGLPGKGEWTPNVQTERGRVAETRFTFKDYAQRNVMQYAGGSDAGAIVVENGTLAAEKVLVTLGWRAANGNEIAVWSYDDESDRYTFTKGEPHILAGATPAEAEWTPAMRWEGAQGLLATYYADYQRAVRRPRVLKVKVVLSASELAAIDTHAPVYMKHTGHYYAIMSLTTKDGGLADAELLQL